jgi:hypothetical protein
MWKYVKNKALFSKTIALFVIVCMISPDILRAQSSSQLPFKTSEIESVLKTLEAIKVETLINDSKYWSSRNTPHWETLSDNGTYWVMENWSASHSNYRLRMAENLNIYFEKKIMDRAETRSPDGASIRRTYNGKFQWVNAFVTKRYGRVKYPDGNQKPGVFTPSFTSYKNSNGDDLSVQIAKAVGFYQGEDGNAYDAMGDSVAVPEVMQRQATLKKEADYRSYQEFEKVADQCRSTLLTRDERKRDLVKKTFNVERKKISYSQSEKDQFVEAIQAKFDSPGKTDDAMIQSILNISLNTSLYTMMIFYEMYLGVMSTSTLVHYYSRPDVFGESVVTNKIYQKAAQRILPEFAGARVKTPIYNMKASNELHGDNLNAEILSFNMDVVRLNNICKKAAINRQNTAVSHTGTFFSTPKQSLSKFTSDEYFKKIYGEETAETLKNIRESKIGILLFADDFREVVGDFSIEKCTQKGVGLNVIVQENVTSAVTEVRRKFIQQIKETVEDFSNPKPTDVIGKYIESYPLTVQKVLAFNKNKDEAMLSCGVIEDIYDWDETFKYINYGLMGAGVAASMILAATGVGALASTAIMGSIFLADVGLNGQDYLKSYRLEDYVKQAAITEQTTREQGLEDIKKAEDMQFDAKLSVVMTVAGEIAGYAIGKYIFYLRKIKPAGAFFKGKDIKAFKTIDEVLARNPTANKDEIFKILEKAKNENKFTNVDVYLKEAGLSPADGKLIKDLVEDAATEVRIYDGIKDILLKRKGKEGEALAALHKVFQTGNVIEKSAGVFVNSPQRAKALVAAKKKLLELGYKEEDATKMLDTLFHERNGTLRGYIQFESGDVWTAGSRPGQNQRLDRTVMPDGPSINRTGMTDAKYHFYRPDLTSAQKEAVREVDTIISKKSADLREKTYKILFEEGHSKGHRYLSASGEWRPDAEKLAALRETRRQLKEIGYTDDEIDIMIRKLANKNVMLLGDPQAYKASINVSETLDAYFSAKLPEEKAALIDQLRAQYKESEAYKTSIRDAGDKFFAMGKGARTDSSDISKFFTERLRVPPNARDYKRILDTKKASDILGSEAKNQKEWERWAEGLNSTIRELKPCSTTDCKEAFVAAVEDYKKLSDDFAWNFRNQSLPALSDDVSAIANAAAGAAKQAADEAAAKMSFARLQKEALTSEEIGELYKHHKGKLGNEFKPFLDGTAEMKDPQAFMDFIMRNYKDIHPIERSSMFAVLQKSKKWSALKLKPAEIEILIKDPNMYKDFYSLEMISRDPLEFFQVSNRMDLTNMEHINAVRNRMDFIDKNADITKLSKDPEILDEAILLADRSIDSPKLTAAFLKQPEILLQSKILQKVMKKIKAGKSAPTIQELDEAITVNGYRKKNRVDMILGSIKFEQLELKKSTLFNILAIKSDYPLVSLEYIDEYIEYFKKAKLKMDPADFEAIAPTYAHEYFSKLQGAQRLAWNEVQKFIKPPITVKSVEEKLYPAYLQGEKAAFKKAERDLAGLDMDLKDAKSMIKILAP